MSDLNSERCPKCFKKFSDITWSNDPLLTKNGSKFVYDEDTGLLVYEPNIDKRFYKGCTLVTNKHIKELQDALDDNKPIGGWTPVEDGTNGIWIPNKIHIRELREAIEIELGITESTTYEERTTIMEQYLNYDEDGTERQLPHQMDWTDTNLTDDIWQGNIKDMHIEDLRKFVTGLMERFLITTPEVYNDEDYTGSYNDKSFSLNNISLPNNDTFIKGWKCVYSAHGEATASNFSTLDRTQIVSLINIYDPIGNYWTSYGQAMLNPGEVFDVMLTAPVPIPEDYPCYVSWSDFTKEFSFIYALGVSPIDNATLQYRYIPPPRPPASASGHYKIRMLETILEENKKHTFNMHTSANASTFGGHVENVINLNFQFFNQLPEYYWNIQSKSQLVLNFQANDNNDNNTETVFLNFNSKIREEEVPGSGTRTIVVKIPPLSSVETIPPTVQYYDYLGYGNIGFLPYPNLSEDWMLTLGYMYDIVYSESMKSDEELEAVELEFINGFEDTGTPISFDVITDFNISKIKVTNINKKIRPI